MKCHRVLLAVVITATVMIKGEDESHFIGKLNLPYLLTVRIIRFGRAKMADKWLQKMSFPSYPVNIEIRGSSPCRTIEITP